LGVGLGSRLPVYCSAAGKALLARLPEAERRELISKLRLTRRAPQTITTKAVLRAELERITAERGLAVEDEELLAGRRALAVTVLDKRAAPLVAVELAAPAGAYTRQRLVEEFGPMVLATAERIAVELGYAELG
jgi:DNA-binding IclR family transcriptional regulator